MKFKIDENLPVEAADILRGAGFAADAVGDENLTGADDAVSQAPAVLRGGS